MMIMMMKSSATLLSLLLYTVILSSAVQLDPLIKAGVNLSTCDWDQEMCVMFMDRYVLEQNQIEASFYCALNETFYEKCVIIESQDGYKYAQPCSPDHHTPQFYHNECIAKGYIHSNESCEAALLRKNDSTANPTVTSQPGLVTNSTPEYKTTRRPSNTTPPPPPNSSSPSTVPAGSKTTRRPSNTTPPPPPNSSSPSSIPAGSKTTRPSSNITLIPSPNGNSQSFIGWQVAFFVAVSLLVPSLVVAICFYVRYRRIKKRLKDHKVITGTNVDGDGEGNGDNNAAGTTIPLDEEGLENIDGTQTELSLPSDDKAAASHPATTLSFTNDKPVGGLQSRPEVLDADADENHGGQDSRVIITGNPDQSVRYSKLFEQEVLEQQRGKEDIPSDNVEDDVTEKSSLLPAVKSGDRNIQSEAAEG